MNLEAIKRKLATVDGLLSVVKTMKSLAAANIRRLEKSVASLEGFDNVVDLGWRAFFRTRPWPRTSTPHGPAVVLALGSDQGMCGSFNESAARIAVELVRELEDTGTPVRLWAMGQRLVSSLEERSRAPLKTFDPPPGLSGTASRVFDLVLAFEDEHRLAKAASFHVTGNALRSRGSGTEPRRLRLLPLDDDFVQAKKNAPWPTNRVPMLGLAPDLMFHRLFRQHLFVSLFRAMAGSMAAENATRLAAMQAAEKNILDLREELSALFSETRQGMVTAELLDIASGYEAVTATADETDGA